MIELERIRSDTSVKIEEWLVEIDDLKERSKFHIPGTKEDDERLDAIACRESSSISYIHETHAKKDREREQDWIERGVIGRVQMLTSFTDVFTNKGPKKRSIKP